MLLRSHFFFFFFFNSQRDCIEKNSSVCRKKKTTDRAIGQQGNYKAESNSAFQHAHLLQVCLILDFEMQSRGEETWIWGWRSQVAEVWTWFSSLCKFQQLQLRLERWKGGQSLWANVLAQRLDMACLCNGQDETLKSQNNPFGCLFGFFF